MKKRNYVTLRVIADDEPAPELVKQALKKFFDDYELKQHTPFLDLYVYAGTVAFWINETVSANDAEVFIQWINDVTGCVIGDVLVTWADTLE